MPRKLLQGSTAFQEGDSAPELYLPARGLSICCFGLRMSTALDVDILLEPGGVFGRRSALYLCARYFTYLWIFNQPNNIRLIVFFFDVLLSDLMTMGLLSI